MSVGAQTIISRAFSIIQNTPHVVCYIALPTEETKKRRNEEKYRHRFKGLAEERLSIDALSIDANYMQFSQRITINSNYSQ